MFACVGHFLPQPKDMQVWLGGDSKLLLGECVRGQLPQYETFPGCILPLLNDSWGRLQLIVTLCAGYVVTDNGRVTQCCLLPDVLLQEKPSRKRKLWQQFQFTKDNAYLPGGGS